MTIFQEEMETMICTEVRERISLMVVLALIILIAVVVQTRSLT